MTKYRKTTQTFNISNLKFTTTITRQPTRLRTTRRKTFQNEHRLDDKFDGMTNLLFLLFKPDFALLTCFMLRLKLDSTQPRVNKRSHQNVDSD